MEVHHDAARKDEKREPSAGGRPEALRNVAAEELRNEIRNKMESLIGATLTTKTLKGLAAASGEVLGKIKERIDELRGVKEDERKDEWKRGREQVAYALEKVGRHAELHSGPASQYIELAKAAAAHPRNVSSVVDTNLDRDLPSVREKLAWMDQTELESVVAKYMAANESGKYTALLEEVGEEWVTRFKGRLDLHAICHLFEKYQRAEIKGGSLLDFEANGGLMSTLYAAAMQQVVDGGNQNNMERILSPVAAFNRDRLSPENLDKPFAWKPDGLDYRVLAAKMEPRYSAAAIAFCNANTPREFVCGLVEGGQPITEDSYDQARVLALLEAAAAELDEKTLKNFFISVHTGCGSLADLQGAVRSPPTEPLPGLFVDIGNTLVETDDLWGLDMEISSLRPEVVEYMRRFRAEGKPVVVFTGGDPESSTEKLRRLGLDEDFLPVRAKHRYKGKLLETLIDDTRAVEQGFTARRQAKVVWIHGPEMGGRRYAFLLDEIDGLPQPKQD